MVHRKSLETRTDNVTSRHPPGIARRGGAMLSIADRDPDWSFDGRVPWQWMIDRIEMGVPFLFYILVKLKAQIRIVFAVI